MLQWFKGQVVEGNRIGRKIDIPTINLQDVFILKKHKRGIYAVWIKISDNLFGGVLYYGPRLILGESHDVIEINIFDFHKKIYGKEIEFALIKFLRPVLDFENFRDLKIRVEKDIKNAKKILQEISK